MACDLSKVEVGDYIETSTGNIFKVRGIRQQQHWKIDAYHLFSVDGMSTASGVFAVALHKSKPQFLPAGWRVENGWLISDKCSVKLFDGDVCYISTDAIESFIPSWCPHALLCREDVDAEYEQHLQNKRRLKWKNIGYSLYEALSEDRAYLVYLMDHGRHQARVSDGNGTTYLEIHDSSALAREACQQYESSLHTK